MWHLLDQLTAKLLIYLVKLYQQTLSPDHSWVKMLRPFGTCRFRPTCSDYTIHALTKYGALKGVYLGAKRLIRCHPWNPGGWDPLK